MKRYVLHIPVDDTGMAIDQDAEVILNDDLAKSAVGRELLFKLQDQHQGPEPHYFDSWLKYLISHWKKYVKEEKYAS